MKKTKIKKDYQFFILLILSAWLFLCLIIIFSSGAYRKFSLLTDMHPDSKFPLESSYIKERSLYNLNNYQYQSFRFSPDGQSFALIEEINEKECLILNANLIDCHDKIDDLIFSKNGQGFSYIAKEGRKVKTVVNGVISDLYDWIFPPYFFSHDAQVFVFRARKGNSEIVVVNNLVSKEYEKVLHIFEIEDENTVVFYGLLNNKLWRGEITW